MKKLPRLRRVCCFTQQQFLNAYIFSAACPEKDFCRVYLQVDKHNLLENYYLLQHLKT